MAESKKPVASEMTFTRCTLCEGSLEFLADACPCKQGGTPGWAPTGLTLGQLQRLANLERALSGDPGLSATESARILDGVRAKLARIEQRAARP